MVRRLGACSGLLSGALRHSYALGHAQPKGNRRRGSARSRCPQICAYADRVRPGDYAVSSGRSFDHNPARANDGTRSTEQVALECAKGEVSDVLLNIEHALDRAKAADKRVAKDRV